jgi:hypothetical protein
MLEITPFLIRAKRSTYAAHGAETAPSRPNSHDLRYDEDNLTYIDSYLGEARFAGEEAVWRDNIPLWSMNYYGVVSDKEHFSGDFLKLALFALPEDKPFRGPAEFTEGEYRYICETSGDFACFNGREEIYFRGNKIYECLFHGGEIE